MSEGFLLESTGGVKARVIPWGATLTHLWIPDGAGRVDDVVLGFAKDEAYRGAHPYFGVMAGRVAGRISGAEFTLEGRRYPLAANDPPNHLHGGVRGFDKQVWEADRLDGARVRFSRVSADGEEGYPGNVRVSVEYRVTAKNELVVIVEAETDAATPFSMTHHSYFNLAGEASGESVEEQVLEILADSYAPTDERMGLLGRKDEATEGNDFRKPRQLGQAIPQLFAQHGDLYFVRGGGEGKIVKAARLVHPRSGRAMTVYTDQPCIQLYTGVGLDGTLKGKEGQPLGRHAGLCLECEGYPDGMRNPELGNILLRPGEKALQRTIYAFETV